MGLKKAFDTSKLSNKTQQILNSNRNIYANVGINGEQIDEVKVKYNKSPGETLLAGPRNTYIKQGYDRPGEVNSGRGMETGAGSITLVAGPTSVKPRSVELSPQQEIQNNLYADPNLSLDAAMIYIEQKTDVDVNFNLASGVGGLSKARSAIVAKADAIRIVGREGVKVVSGVDMLNSVGGKIKSVPRIEFIAGNNGNALQSVAKSGANGSNIGMIYKRLDELSAALDFFVTSQLEFNSQIASHTHPTPFAIMIGFNGGQSLPSPALLAGGAKVCAQEAQVKSDNIKTKLKITTSKLTSTTAFGATEAGSKSIFST